MIDEMKQRDFREIVWAYYRDHGRHDLPWRATTDPYAIMVSEVMLQQTQVVRVIPKYEAFLRRFPDVKALAVAPLGEVLRAWSGLGYNRRAKYLHQAARAITGSFPETLDELVKLPGIGANTAGAILAYGFNQPVVFVETNIRTVYLHHFFADREAVADREILELVRQTLDREHPREFNWGLMDYGVHIKQTVGNQNQRSRSYAKQSAFAGSQRHVRGQVLRLLAKAPMSQTKLAKQIGDERLEVVLRDLIREGLIRKQKSLLSL